MNSGTNCFMIFTVVKGLDIRLVLIKWSISLLTDSKSNSLTRATIIFSFTVGMVVSFWFRSSSYSFSPGRRPVKTIGISFSGVYPASRIILRARSKIFTGSPIRNSHKVADDIRMGHCHRSSRCDLFAEIRNNRTVAAQHIAESRRDELRAILVLGVQFAEK